MGLRGFLCRLLIIGILCSSFCFGEVILNEVMYDPLENSNYNEWIEIYNNGTENVSIENFTICSNKLNLGYINKSGVIFRNESYVLTPNSYAVITDGGSGTEVFDYNPIFNETKYFHVDASSICGGLSDSGDTIIISDGLNNFTSFYNNTALKGYSLELIYNEFIQSNNFRGTIGLRNNATKKVITLNVSYETDVFINVSKSNYSLNEKLNISGFISINDTNVSINLSIKIARKINDSWNYKWYLLEEKAFVLSNLTNLSDIIPSEINYSIPDNFIKGDYKIHASLKYKDNESFRYKYSDSYFYVEGVEDLGEYTFDLVSFPDSMRFGDVKSVFVKFDSNNYKLRNVSLVAYVYTPKWASIDLNDDTLMTRVYNSSVAVKLEEIKRGTTNYFTIPIYSKKNCENEYTNGVYGVKVRIYENDETLLEKSFNITISDINDAMCPKTIEKTSGSSKVCETKISKSDKENVNEVDKKKVFSYDKISFNIDVTKEIENTFDVKLDIKNSNESKDLVILAYVVSSRTKISEIVKKDVSLNEYDNISINLSGNINRFDLDKDLKLILKINSSDKKTEKSVSYPIDIKFKVKEFGKILDVIYVSNDSNNLFFNVDIDCNNITSVIFEAYNLYSNYSCKKSMKFKINSSNENNVYFLSLRSNNDTKDVKRLEVIKDKKEVEESINLLNKVNNDNLSFGSNKNSVTGNAVKLGILYESSNEKLKKLINYLLPIVFIIGVIAYIWSRKDGI